MSDFPLLDAQIAAAKENPGISNWPFSQIDRNPLTWAKVRSGLVTVAAIVPVLLWFAAAVVGFLTSPIVRGLIEGYQIGDEMIGPTLFDKSDQP